MHALVFPRHDRSFAAICGASYLTASICRNEIVVVVKQFSYDLLIHLRLRKTYYICMQIIIIIIIIPLFQY